MSEYVQSTLENDNKSDKLLHLMHQVRNTRMRANQLHFVCFAHSLPPAPLKICTISLRSAQLALMPTSGETGDDAWKLLLDCCAEIRGLKKSDIKVNGGYKIPYDQLEKLIKKQQNVNESGARLKELESNLEVSE